MNILCKQEFVQTIVIMAPWGSRPSCAGSFATLIRGLVVRTGADGSRRSLRRLMNYDNVAPEGKSLLQYLLGCADRVWRFERRRWREASDCWRLWSYILLLSYPVTCLRYCVCDLILYMSMIPLTEDFTVVIHCFLTIRTQTLIVPVHMNKCCKLYT